MSEQYRHALRLQPVEHRRSIEEVVTGVWSDVLQVEQIEPQESLLCPRRPFAARHAGVHTPG